MSFEEHINGLSDTYADNVRKIWNDMLVLIPTLPEPTQSGGAFDGMYSLVWDCKEHHLEIDISPNNFEWFYRNRSTEEYTGEEECDSITDSLISHLKIINFTRLDNKKDNV